MHARTQIRDRVAVLLGDLPTTQDRVYVGRMRPLGAEHPPTLLIYVTDEQSELHAKADRAGDLGGSAILLRTLTLVIEGRVSVAGEPDDLLDTIASEVEPVMGGALMLPHLLSQTLTATHQSVQAQGASHIGELRLEYEVMYRTREAAPDVIV